MASNPEASANLTNPNPKDPWFYNASWNWFTWNIFSWLFPLICLIGAIANACSFGVIMSNRKSFPYVTRQYLIIITLTDVLILTCKVSTHYFGYLAFYVKDNAWTWFTVPRNWGFVWCIVYDFITYYSSVGAPFFQLGLTVDRVVAVAAPMKAKIILTHRRSWILLAVIAAMALVLPVMFVSNRRWNSDTGLCDVRIDTFYVSVYLPIELYFGKVFLVLSLILGSVVICGLLAWNNRSAQRMQAETASQQVLHSGRERQRSLVRISIMLVSINVIFLVTSLPWTVGNMLHEGNLLAGMDPKAYIIMMRHFNSLLFMNSALSWPVYFMGGNFRLAFIRIFVPSRCQSGGGGGTGQGYRCRSEAAGPRSENELSSVTVG